MKNLWTKKIPTLIGLILILAGTITTTFLVKGGTIFQIKAGPGQDPKNVKITNLSDYSFTVSYKTDDKVIGTINFGISSGDLDGIALDDRDQLSQQINKYNYHSITIRNLDPNTKYYFSINSGDKNYNNTGFRFEVLTKDVISDTPSSQVPISGKVVLPDGTAPNDGLVYVKIEEAEPISTLIKNDGTYTLPLNNLRKLIANEYFEIKDDTIIIVDIYSNSQFSTANVRPDDISPVPLITLSGNYDFSNSVTPEVSNTDQNEGFPSFGNILNSSDPKILNPSSGEKLTETIPKFEGTAEPNETVTIEIHSDENIKTQVKADSDGNWEYTPTKELSPGNHTIKIVTKNKDGILKTITKNFIVFAEEVTNTPTPTTKVTMGPSVSPTFTPTPFANDTQISPVPTLPPTGNSSVIIASILGFAATIFGISMFFLTRGRSSI